MILDVVSECTWLSSMKKRMCWQTVRSVKWLFWLLASFGRTLLHNHGWRRFFQSVFLSYLQRKEDSRSIGHLAETQVVCVQVEEFGWFWDFWEIWAQVGRASGPEGEPFPSHPLARLFPSNRKSLRCPLGPLLSLLIKVQDLLTHYVHGCRGLDRAPCRPRVHKHVGNVVSKVYFAVCSDGLVLHQLQVLWG